MENTKTYTPPKQERDYSHIEVSLFELSDKNLELLEQILKITIESEKECSRAYRLARPDSPDFNDCCRIKPIIDKYKSCWESNPNKSKEDKPALTAHLAPINSLK